MFLRFIDKFFNHIKQLFALVIFLFIALATFFFIYWLIHSVNIPLPSFVNDFALGTIDFFFFPLKHKPIYVELQPILPIFTCAIFIFLTYVINCLIAFLEFNNKVLKNHVQNQRVKLEKKINAQLHKGFIEELKVFNSMSLKLKVVATEQVSYLTQLNDNPLDTVALAQRMQEKICDLVIADCMHNKYCDSNSVTFVVNDLSVTADFIAQVVEKASLVINEEIRPKLDISFYCGVELMKDVFDVSSVSGYLDKILDLKIKNRITVSPKFKVYFENIMPNVYHFDVAGEYNISDNPNIVKNIMLYSIRKK